MLKVEKGKKMCVHFTWGFEEEKGEGKEDAMKSTFSSQSPHKNLCLPSKPSNEVWCYNWILQAQFLNE